MVCICRLGPLRATDLLEAGFEHVRHPEELLSDIARVLRPGGQSIGSTSQLEPYHSLSLWNYTPYGFRVLVEGAGLKLDKIRPSIDA
jgi:hypothetical protein